MGRRDIPVTEALAPATRGQAAESAKAEEAMRGSAEFKGTRESLVIAELDRLRAALATSEAETASIAKMHADTADKLRKAYSDLADMKVRHQLAVEENAELRKLCGRAVAAIDRWRKGETYAVDNMRDEIESAARRAGK